MKVGIATLGCKVNAYESEFVMNQLVEAGYEIGDFSEPCDVYIINTCTVTNTFIRTQKPVLLRWDVLLRPIMILQWMDLIL